MIARFLGVRVWELPQVPFHYQDEAEAILIARYQAVMELAKDNSVTPEKIVLPDF